MRMKRVFSAVIVLVFLISVIVINGVRSSSGVGRKQPVISEKDIELAENFYLLSGMDEENAHKRAAEYVEKRETLYQEAVSNGYDVTDQEVWDYLEELKVIINQADNREDALKAMGQFESEEAYWEYEFTVYKINLPIQNYVRDMEKTFIE